MDVAYISIFQSDLRQQIVRRPAEDELYVQIKDKLQQQSPKNKYEGYKLEVYALLTYKNIIYIPSVEYLRRVVMDEIHGINFLFPFWNWKRPQQTWWVLMLKLYLLTFHAL